MKLVLSDFAQFEIAFISDLSDFTNGRLDALACEHVRPSFAVPSVLMALANESIRRASHQTDAGVKPTGSVWEEFTASLPLIADVAQLERPGDGYSPPADALLRMIHRECSRVRMLGTAAGVRAS